MILMMCHSERGSMATFLTCELRTVDGETLGVLVLQEKTFASGSRGYYGQAKVELGGRRYQVQAQAIEIGSKGDAQGESEG